jgi:hypothetical protein
MVGTSAPLVRGGVSQEALHLLKTLHLLRGTLILLREAGRDAYYKPHGGARKHPSETGSAFSVDILHFALLSGELPQSMAKRELSCSSARRTITQKPLRHRPASAGTRNWQARQFRHRAWLLVSPSSSSRRSCSHQCDGERAAAQHHQSDKPPDGAFGVVIGAGALRNVPDRCRLSLDPAALGGQGGAFRLQGCQG